MFWFADPYSKSDKLYTFYWLIGLALESAEQEGPLPHLRRRGCQTILCGSRLIAVNFVHGNFSAVVFSFGLARAISRFC